MGTKKKHLVFLQTALCYYRMKQYPKALAMFNQCLQAQHGFAEVTYSFNVIGVFPSWYLQISNEE